MIYLDHQATTPVDDQIFAQMIPYFTESFGNPHSTDHSLGWDASRAVEEAASRVARLVGADIDEIIFTSGATESNNLALLGVARRLAAGKRHRVLVTAIEHKCVLAVAREIEKQLDVTVEKIPVDREGFVDASAFEAMLDNEVLVVSIMAVNNEIGTIQDIEGLSRLAKKHGAIFHCDAAQAPIAMDLSTFADHVDILSLSAHKMYGPKGVGIAYVARNLIDRIEPLIYGGGQQNGLRSGTVPVPLCVGMGAAADMLVHPTTEERRIALTSRRERFVSLMTSLPWQIEVNGPTGQRRHPGNANLRFEGFSSHDILAAIQPHIAASTGAACTSGIPEPSHVLKAIGLTSDDSESSIRFSLGFGTSDDDINMAAALIAEALERLIDSNLFRGA